MKHFSVKFTGQTTCCFINEKCGKNMNEINDKMFEKSVGFLKKPKKYLNYLVKNIGYDTCRRTKEYDAKRCYKDCQVKDATYFVSFQIYFKFCQKLEKSKFAKSCTVKGGLYKCCIRRDKEFCHECRFCCTLSVCTTKDGSYFKDSSIREVHFGKKSSFYL